MIASRGFTETRTGESESHWVGPSVVTLLGLLADSHRAATTVRSGDRRRSAQDGRATQARRVPGAQHGRRRAAGGLGHKGRGPVERERVAPRARSGPGQGPARPARFPHCCQGRLVAKLVVPVISMQEAVAATALGNTWLVTACASQKQGPMCLNTRPDLALFLFWITR